MKTRNKMKTDHKRSRLKEQPFIKRMIAEAKVCAYCKKEFTDFNKWRSKTIDHIIPFFLGGTNDLTNIKVVCNQCNNLKASHEQRFGVVGLRDWTPEIYIKACVQQKATMLGKVGLREFP